MTVTKTSTHVPDLHDATLLRVEFEWSTGTLTLIVRTEHGERALTIINVIHVELSRTMPWGPSNSINEVRVHSVPDSTTNDGVSIEFVLELQSGDSIRIVGASLSVAS